MAKWKKYTGSDEQLEEINNSKCFLLKRKDGAISFVLYPPYHPNNMDSETTIEYLIGSHHPYADLIKIWADTGCEVWVREPIDYAMTGDMYKEYVTYHPDWNIPNAKFRLTQFED